MVRISKNRNTSGSLRKIQYFNVSLSRETGRLSISASVWKNPVRIPVSLKIVWLLREIRIFKIQNGGPMSTQ